MSEAADRARESAGSRQGDRQKRSPRQAAAEARANRVASRWPELVVNELSDFPTVWARWAVIAAAFVAAGSERGPRIRPGFAWFEGSRGGGCTLYALPGDRAVLSGGWRDAPSSDVAYGDGLPLRDLFKGAPDWVADPVLNPRAGVGLMSFCYWWEGGCWYRGESPPVAECATAVPGVWTAHTVAGIIGDLVGDSGVQKQAAELLISAAQQGVVTRDAFMNLFDDVDIYDIDGAVYQLSLAGLMYSASPREISKDQAFRRVRQYIESQGIAVSEDQLSRLAWDRLGTGWRVCLPVSEGDDASGQDVLYVDDDGDGMVDKASSSRLPAKSVADFERRFRKRHAPGV